MEEHGRPFDVCIVCALAKEAEAVVHEFSDRCENIQFQQAFSEKNGYVYRYTTLENSRGETLTVLIICMPFTGPIETVLGVRSLLEEFHPRFVAMTGICAGYKEKVALGDLVAASYAFHHEEGKVAAGEEGQDKLQPEWRTHGPTKRIVQYLNTFVSWEPLVVEMKQRLLGRELQHTERPKCLIAPIASGMAVQGNNPFPRLLEHNRKALFLDQEVAAFYQTLHESPNLYFLAVKGVCDYADPNKNDQYHDYAARASAVYLLAFIQEYVTEQTMPRRDALPSSDRAGGPVVWNVPYRRNPHFTGRADLLDRLDQQLSLEMQDDPTATRRAALMQPQAIKGLGGIGKTQIAVEYAYRSHEQGRYTHTLWVNAATEEALITSFAALAELLPGFSAKGETDQRKLVEAIKRWIEWCEQRWLLIFDNADDVLLLQDYLPQRGNGSVLFTTRADAVGALALSIEVETMGFVEGTQLLLRRAQRFEHASDEEINEAGNIVVALDHFPLALDQAGAYIEETKCSFADYLSTYQDHRKALLTRRGTQMTNYPDSVATTWSLSFRRIEQANPVAAELLRLLAYLSPDRIPEELIKNCATHWTPSLRQAASDLFTFNQMIEELLKFSLVKRLAEDQVLSIHRLVQAVQVDRMELEVQRQWAERVILAVNEMFPRISLDAATWPQCLRYLEQAQACDTLIRQYRLVLAEAADLLNRTGNYLRERASYTIAEPLFQRALGIREQQVASSLNSLANLYIQQGKYVEAESLCQRSLLIREHELGPEHPDVASSLRNLALVYFEQGKHVEAEPLYQRALHIREQQLKPEHLDVADALYHLAVLYRTQGKHVEAEPLFQRALHIFEQQEGPESLKVAFALHGLAYLYVEQGKFAEAEPFYQRALHIREQQLKPEHPNVAISLNALASLYVEQGKYAEAEPLFQRTLSIQEQQLGPEHPYVGSTLNNLAELYREQGKHVEAESFYQRALHVFEQLGPEHPYVAHPLNGLANLYIKQGKYAEAESLFQRVLSIRIHTLEPHHPDIAETLHHFAALRCLQGNQEEGVLLYKRALSIREKVFGPQHPSSTDTRHSLRATLIALGKMVEATQLDAVQSESVETNQEAS